jgi:hypothetical protein
MLEKGKVKYTLEEAIKTQKGILYFVDRAS